MSTDNHFHDLPAGEHDPQSGDHGHDGHDGPNNVPRVDPKLRPQYEGYILRMAALLGSLSIFGAVIRWLFPGVNFADPKTIQVIIVALNFLVLMIFCLSAINVPQLQFRLNNKEAAVKKYIELLNIGSEELGLFNNMRVNLLAKQLNNNLIYYALTLLVVYVIYILEHLGLMNESIYAKALQDIFNYLSSVFLYLAFKVLYDKTLDDNNTRMIYYMDALFFSGFYILVYLALFNNAKEYIRNDLSLFSGIFNGMAMGLLFGRFISMEHFLTRLFEDSGYKNIIKNQKLYYFGTVFLLPLYVLAQPLFGDFKLNEFGNPDVFANMVFLVCFVGKLFFLISYFTYAKKRLLHLYLHLVITKYGVPRDFISCFEFR